MRQVLMALFVAALAVPALAQEEPPNAPQYRPANPGQTRAPRIAGQVALNVEVVTDRLATPWAIEFLPDGRLLVTERLGTLRVLSPTGELSRPIAGLPSVATEGQGGLLDVALSPDFSRDRRIYWSYAEPRGERRNGTSVARGRLSENLSRLTDVEVIFRQEPAWRSDLHFGSRLVWDRQGRLFVTLGERSHNGARQLAQDLGGLLGKVVRITADGSVPPGNPTFSRPGARPEIWSYGHRNIQGAALNPTTGDLWTIEHGPRGGDELNAPKPGRNYGWPIITYGIEYSGGRIGAGETARSGMEQPIYYWDPVIAPSGMSFYQGALFPGWNGDLVIASLRGGLVRLKLNGERVIGEQRLLTEEGSFRDVQVAADGALWVAAPNGRVLRITPR